MIIVLFWIIGIFSILLGLLHFTFPRRFGFVNVITEGSAPLPPFRLSFFERRLERSDLCGLIYVMNHCVSYTITIAGVFDLFVAMWLNSFAGSIAVVAIGGFWFVRAITQFHLGRRKGDFALFVCFAFVGTVHLTVGVFGLAGLDIESTVPLG